MKKILKNNQLYILGAVLGGIVGYTYWKLIGCNTGTCPITSSPMMSTLWGIAIGALFLGIFKKETKNKKK